MNERGGALQETIQAVMEADAKWGDMEPVDFARAICEHLGVTHEVKRAMARVVMRLDDSDSEDQARASTGVAAIATLLEAAAIPRDGETT